MYVPDTLFNAVYRTTFRNKTTPGWRDNRLMRLALEGANRFVADDRFARFMGELANEAFLRTEIKNPIRMRLIDSLRIQARVPHKAIWIEYPLREFHKQAQIVRESHGMHTPNDPNLQPVVEGWLIQQHPKIETAAIMHIFTHDPVPDQDGFRTWTFPFAYAWVSDDNPLPWHAPYKEAIDNTLLIKPLISEYLTGLMGYRHVGVNIVRSPLIENPRAGFDNYYTYLFREWLGILRRVWVLLATINDLPVTVGEVRYAKGFLGGGRIRKYLDHKTLTLNIPASIDTRVLARKAIAHAHRRRHPVRAFWRDHWKHPPDKNCRPHLWELFDGDVDGDTIECVMCKGRQVFVHEHERGDASLGYVTHSYNLKHETE